jgi:hypothetical protein
LEGYITHDLIQKLFINSFPCLKVFEKNTSKKIKPTRIKS